MVSCSSSHSCGFGIIFLKNKFGIKIELEEPKQDSFVSDHNLRKVTLHDWQKSAIDFFWENNGKVVYEVTTGAGKTFCTIEILKEILKKEPNAYTLIVVPKNVILEKGWFPDLYDNGFTMAQVGVYYGFAKEIKPITITNMQSIKHLDMSLFDIIVFDEIHNYCTNRMFPYIEHKSKYKIGLSATVERIDSAHWRMLKAFDYNKFVYSAKDALDDGVLNQFKYYNVEVIMDEENYDTYLELTQKLGSIIKQGGSYSRIMNGLAGDEIKNRMLKVMNERKQLVLNYPLKMEVLKLICKKHENQKTLVFNEYNKVTTSCYFQLLDVKIKARVVHSGVSKIQIDKILNDYKNEKFNTLLTTKVLDEGYNLPAIEVGIIQAGNSTAKQTIQRMGRILRKKNKPSILYQIYVKNTMEEEQAIKRAELFKQLSFENKDYMFDDEEGLVEI